MDKKRFEAMECSDERGFKVFVSAFKRKQYFNSRSSLPEFLWTLVWFLVFAVAPFTAIVFYARSLDGLGALALLPFIFFFIILGGVLFVMLLTVLARRYHDVGLPGWVALMIVPIYLFNAFMIDSPESPLDLLPVLIITGIMMIPGFFKQGLFVR